MENTERHHRIVVIGGGNGGLSVAGRLRRSGVDDVVVIEPRREHVFAPLQSHIAGGVARASEAVRAQEDVTPRGVGWIQDRVVSIDPRGHVVTLASGERMTYEHLIVSVGLETRYDAVPGLAEVMTTPQGLSSYTFDLAAKASPALRDLREGTVVFVQQPEPGSAAGVAQKPMYLASDWWRAQGRLDRIRVVFVTPEKAPFRIPAIAQELRRKLDEYGIETRFGATIQEVRPATREVVLRVGRGTETIPYDLLHAAPPQSPPDFIAESGLAADDDPHGFVHVDPETLRHREFDDVWAVGDAASLTTLRSGGGIRKQSKVVARNVLAALRGQPPRARYDGYSVTPITVSRHTVVFAEFDGDGNLAPTVPGWKTLYRERRLSYFFDRRVLPWVYWHMILQGRA